ncbi:MAG: DUF4412 domain-containing protein [Bacteroidetes bacterium]|nr:DUF4412 domain-containing protein [Bacteroidota bacterium]
MKKLSVILCALVMSTAAMAQGTYLEFKMSSAEGMGGTMKTYTQDGNVRTEMNMVMPAMPGGALRRTALILKSDPKTSYLLNDEQKTYTVNTMGDKEPSMADHTDYEVTVIGKEKVNGYEATHVRVKAKGSQLEEDLWTSPGVLSYDKYKASLTKYTSANMYKALAAKGADGFPVRIVAGEHGRNIQMDLVKAETRSNPASLFSLAGYTKTEGGYTGSMREGAQNAVNAIQNMTPEQRQQWIDSIRRAHGR